MSARGTLDGTAWPEGIIQLLDDHHLVVLSEQSESRRRFGAMLERQLSVLGETEVVEIEGREAVDLPSFCRQLESRLPVAKDDLNRWWRDMASVIRVLRHAGGGGFRESAPKRRYFLWHEADTMLEADVALFCRIVNALFGVAAESEHTSLDPVVVQRVIFLGGDKLGAYAEDVNGQFCSWMNAAEGEDSPFWEIMSVVDRPRVITYRIDG